MKFRLASSKIDPVKTWRSEDGFYKIIKRPSSKYILKRVSAFNLMGDEVGEFNTLEKAIASVR